MPGLTSFLAHVSERHGAVSTDHPASRHSRREIHRERAQSLVEISLILPLFLLLIVGVVEVASALNTQITVVNAARDGARLGSKGGATSQQIKDLVVAETQRLQPAVNGSSDVKVQNLTVNGTSAVRVEVCATHSLILGLRLVMPENYRMCSNSVMRVAGGGS